MKYPPLEFWSTKCTRIQILASSKLFWFFYLLYNLCAYSISLALCQVQDQHAQCTSVLDNNCESPVYMEYLCLNVLYLLVARMNSDASRMKKTTKSIKYYFIFSGVEIGETFWAPRVSNFGSPTGFHDPEIVNYIN